MPLTRTTYDHLRAKLLRNLSEAESLVSAAKKKLDALEILETELLEDEQTDSTSSKDDPMDGENDGVGTRSLDGDELLAVLDEAPMSFTHIFIREIAQSKFGPVNGRSIRIGLNKLADKPNSPIEVVETGKGQRPTVFRKKEII